MLRSRASGPIGAGCSRMSRYRMNDHGEWVRVFKDGTSWSIEETIAREEASKALKRTMADYRREAEEISKTPEGKLLEEQRQYWKMNAPLSGAGNGSSAGTVYVIQDIATGMYKIGRTKNLDRRMKELGVGKTAKLIQHAEVSDSFSVEKAAHRRYSSKRLPQSEYFKLNSPPSIF
jgi:predicted GIY-YIG superfamily endonuclease